MFSNLLRQIFFAMKTNFWTYIAFYEQVNLCVEKIWNLVSKIFCPIYISNMVSQIFLRVSYYKPDYTSDEHIIRVMLRVDLQLISRPAKKLLKIEKYQDSYDVLPFSQIRLTTITPHPVEWKFLIIIQAVPQPYVHIYRGNRGS